MTQRQITNHKSDNLLVLIGSTRVLSEIILKIRHLKYRRRSDDIVYLYATYQPLDLEKVI
jgi:hypothetical protein